MRFERKIEIGCLNKMFFLLQVEFILPSAFCHFVSLPPNLFMQQSRVELKNS